jgi:transposase InsO family protein
VPSPAQEALFPACQVQSKPHAGFQRPLGGRRYVWTRFDGRVCVNAVLDRADRECVGLNVSQRDDAREVAWALEDALLRRFGGLPPGDTDVIPRTDSALANAFELYRDLTRSYGPESGAHSAAHAGVERRHRIVHGNAQA